MADGDARFRQGAHVVLGKMALVYLYTQLLEATDPTTGSIAGYMYILKVVVFSFL